MKLHHAVLWRSGIRRISRLFTGILCILLPSFAVHAQDEAFKIGETPPMQDVFTKVNLTEPYDIVEGFTIFPSLVSPDLFYYYPKPRVARTKEGRLVFRLLSYAMAENRNQVGSADVAGGYLQFDVTMSPTPAEEEAIKKALLNPPKRFKSNKLATLKDSVVRPVRTASGETNKALAAHPYLQLFGANARPKLQNVRLAPIPIHNLKAMARIPGVLESDQSETEWFDANGDASGTTTFAINLSSPQAIALYQAIENPAAVEPFNVYFTGDLGGYIKCKAKLTVKTSEIFSYLQEQQGSSKKTERPGSRGVSIFGIVDIGGRESKSTHVEQQTNDIDISHLMKSSIRIEGDLQGYDQALMSIAKYALDQAMVRFGNPIPLEDLMDPKNELKDPALPPGAPAGNKQMWAYIGWKTHGIIGQGRDKGRSAYYGYYDEKTLNRANSASFEVDLDKQIAVSWQFSPSTSIFDDTIISEIQKHKQQYAQKMALNDPFFEKLDITYAANLDFAGGPFNKVVFNDTFRLKNGSGYSIPGLLLESEDNLDQEGNLIGARPPQNLRFSGLLQGNLYQGDDTKGTFSILNASARRAALREGKWPMFPDGTQVKGVTHRWSYRVYFRPSTRDIDFPPYWDSPEFVNSETVLTATLPPKVAVITVSPMGLGSNVNGALVKIRYKGSLSHRSKKTAETIKSCKIRPNGPDKRLYFFDDEPQPNLPFDYSYTLYYTSGKTHEQPWQSTDGGLMVVSDPNAVGIESETLTPVFDDNF